MRGTRQRLIDWLQFLITLRAALQAPGRPHRTVRRALSQQMAALPEEPASWGCAADAMEPPAKQQARTQEDLPRGASQMADFRASAFSRGDTTAPS